MVTRKPRALDIAVRYSRYKVAQLHSGKPRSGAVWFAWSILWNAWRSEKQFNKSRKSGAPDRGEREFPLVGDAIKYLGQLGGYKHAPAIEAPPIYSFIYYIIEEKSTQCKEGFFLYYITAWRILERVFRGCLQYIGIYWLRAIRFTSLTDAEKGREKLFSCR